MYSPEEYYNAFIIYGTVLGIVLMAMIIGFFIASRKSYIKQKLSDECMKETEGYNNGKVHLYFPEYFKKKRKKK